MTLIGKPYITVFGDDSWCDHIVCNCIPNLPMEPTEWIRKKGSEHKLVHVDIDTKEFYQNNLLKNDDSVLGCPLFHIFVILENEDLYQNSTKTKFSNWIGLLRSRSLDNWKLIIVPDGSIKQKTKFTINKFIMANKLKIDFNLQKIDDHLIRISENSRERFGQIQKFLRDTVLSTYDDMCYKIEDKIRIQRETRYTHLWNYFDYFYLQEELANIYECLNLYDESLAQFDESDAVFSRCLESFHKGENAAWISLFKNVPFVKIDCLILTNYSDPEKRFDLLKGHLCLADFRAYLLSRQCALLQLLNRYQEIPALVYSTLLKFLIECDLLKVEVDLNLKSCWIFLTALQALQRFSPIDCEDLLAQDYAALFQLALNSINKLALSLNVWSPDPVDWEPINVLKEKLSILSNDEYGDTPSSRLAGGFKSQIDFQDFHSKVFEEAIMIWKHIGRVRSANLLGIQLADLYCKAKQYDKAEPLYMKAIKCLRKENWAHLAMPLRLKLAVCQKDKFENDPEKYLKTCIHLAGATFSPNEVSFNPELSLKNDSDHQLYYNELKKCINILYHKTKKPQQFKIEPLFSIKTISLSSPNSDGFQTVEVAFYSHLSQPTNVKLAIYGTKFPELDLTEPQNTDNIIDPSTCNTDLVDFPVEYSIPLSSATSPRIYRTEKQGFASKKFHGELHCQLSIDEDVINMKDGVSVHIRDAENDCDEDNDKILSLICFPKIDAGLKARKISISQDIGFSFNSPTENRKMSRPIDGTTIFNNNNNKKGTTSSKIIPGRNDIKLTSQKYGLYIPNAIEIFVFNDEALLQDSIDPDILDSSWTDYETIQTYLPDFIIDDPLEYFGFVNFTNQINPKIKMGKLAFPANEIELKLYVNNEEVFSAQNIFNESQKEPTIIGPGQLMQHCGLLDYDLRSEMDKVTFCIPNLIKKQFDISFFEKIFFSKHIIQTGSSKYVISVSMERPIDATRLPRCDYQIKNPALKLHHQNDVRQLLPLVHRSLATGVFNDYTQFTILWFLESNDIVNFDKDSLRFTLSIDLTLQIGNVKQLTGIITHEFELRNN